MNKKAMQVTVLAASLALSGMAMAGGDKPAAETTGQPVATVTDAKKAPQEAGTGAAVTDAKETKKKSAPDASQAKAAGAAKGDAKTAPPAAEVKDNSAKK